MAGAARRSTSPHELSLLGMLGWAESMILYLYECIAMCIVYQ